jgi:hypothetical protein
MRLVLGLFLAGLLIVQPLDGQATLDPREPNVHNELGTGSVLDGSSAVSDSFRSHRLKPNPLKWTPAANAAWLTASPTSVRTGILWGVYLGTAVGLITGPLAAPRLHMETWVAVLVFGGSGAITGALAGAGLGSLLGEPSATPRAEPVRLRQSLDDP